MLAGFVIFFRNRVVAAATPGIASDNSFYGEPAAPEKTMFTESFYAIG